MTFSFTVPMWAIDGFMVLGCISCALSIIKTIFEIKLKNLQRKKFF